MQLEAIILTLLAIKGIGPRTVEKIIFEVLQAGPLALHDLLDFAKERRIRIPDVADDDLFKAEDSARSILRKCEQEGIKYLHRWNSEFPDLLKNIPNAPVNLFALGDHRILKEDGIAVVGTRSPTEFGMKSARKIAARAVEQGFVVVSGLAEGCDTGGHLGALDLMGKTVAVLAHGFGTIYPPSNSELAERILNEHGCLLTEYPPGSLGHPTKFVARDRLQSGLSKGTIVIETDVEGGTMHTVGFTIAQGRLLGAIQHPEKLRSEPKAQGNQKLIKDGAATPIESQPDLEEFLKKAKGAKSEPIPSQPSIQQTDLFGS